MAEIRFYATTPPAVLLANVRGCGTIAAFPETLVEERGEAPGVALLEAPRFGRTWSASGPFGVVHVQLDLGLGHPDLSALPPRIRRLLAERCSFTTEKRVGVVASKVHEADIRPVISTLMESLDWHPGHASRESRAVFEAYDGATALAGRTLARLFADVITGRGLGSPEDSDRVTVFRDWVATAARLSFPALERTLHELVTGLSPGTGILSHGGCTHDVKHVSLEYRKRVSRAGYDVIFWGSLADRRADDGSWLDAFYQDLADGLAGAPETAGLRQAVDGQDERNHAFSKEVRARQIHGTGTAWPFSVTWRPAHNFATRRRAQPADEFWLRYQLPPFMLEAGRGLVLDYSAPEAAASVAIRLDGETVYPSAYCHGLFLQPHGEAWKRAWLNYPNVGGRECGADAWPICCGDGPLATLKRSLSAKLSPGQMLKTALQTGHDTVLLGFRASNPNSVFHIPTAIVDEARIKKVEVPYRVLSPPEVWEKRRRGVLFIPFER